eukprot:3833064-Pleurochrysis_carterae.AAC.1
MASGVVCFSSTESMRTPRCSRKRTTCETAAQGRRGHAACTRLGASLVQRAQPQPHTPRKVARSQPSPLGKASRA